MSYEDNDDYYDECDKRQIYTEKCRCGKEHQIETQKDNNPEYRTCIFVKCGCEKHVYFSLPVN